VKNSSQELRLQQMQRDPAHWSSASSPEEDSQTQVESFLVVSSLTTDAPTVKVKTLSCGFMCQGKDKNGSRNCRKMVSGHIRGAVCPDCMDESKYFQCSTGCLAYIHVACADGALPWMCQACRGKSQEEVLSNCSNSEDELGSNQQEGSEPDEEKQSESIEFENYNDCHAFLRENHFICKKKRFNKQMRLTHVDYMCEKSKCSTKFTVRRRGESEVWLAPLLLEHQVGTTAVTLPVFVQSRLILSSGRMQEQKQTRRFEERRAARGREIENYKCNET
jgi:hypothetical protein